MVSPLGAPSPWVTVRASSAATSSHSAGSSSRSGATSGAARGCIAAGAVIRSSTSGAAAPSAVTSRRSSRTSKTEGLFTVEYPDERLPVYERFRVLPVLIYDADDGNVRCTSCNICAKVCPPQCIWMTHAKAPDGKPVPLPEDFYIDMDVCMNCGLCAEYCPFDAIKMDQNFELSNYERHQTHIYSMQDLLVSSDYYARTHPEAWDSSDEVVERGKVAKKKDQRLQKALTATAKPAPAPKAARPPSRSSAEKA